jgi:hypothetical protein
LNRPRTASGGDGTHGGRALVLLGAIVVVAVLLLRHTGTSVVAGGPVASRHTATTTAGATTTVPATTTTTLPAIAPSQVKLLVLNGTGAGSLASQTRARLAASPGYNTLAPDDTTSTVQASAIYAVSAQYLGAADALAQTVGLPVSAVQASIPASAPIRSNERTVADLVLVIGPGFSLNEGGSTPAPGSATGSSSTTSASSRSTSTTTHG